MMRRTSLSRTGFKRKPAQRVTLPLDDELFVTIERVAPRLYRVPAPSASVFAPQPKFHYVDSRPYRVAVASLPCYRCGIVGYTQCCHSDAGADGKGGSIKACDLSSWPGCGPRPGVNGCHWEIGHGAVLGREAKREFEQAAVAATQSSLVAMAATDRRLQLVLVSVGLLK